MDRIQRCATLFLLAVPVWAAGFENGQAARAVIGQPSFSAQDTGIAPTTLTISNGRLYAADAAHHLLTFDLTQIPGPKDELRNGPGGTCLLCGFAPIASIVQPVFPGTAAISAFGKTVIVADAPHHRVLIWRDTSSPHSIKGPDLVLGRSSDFSPISASTIADPISVAYDGKRLFVGDAALHRVLIWNSLPLSDTQPADVVLGQQNFTSANVTDAAGPASINRPSALASDGTNLYVADSADHRILVFSTADTLLPEGAVLNSASFESGPVAPGTLITIDGTGLSDVTESAPDDSSRPLPVSLAGVEIFLDGSRLPLASTSPEQIRAQIPYQLENVSSASLYVRVQHSDGTVTTTNPITVDLLPTAPGLFAFGGADPRSGMVLHTGTDLGSGAPVTADDPAKPGEVLVVWAAGLGAVDDGDSKNGVTAGVPYQGTDAPVLTPVSAIANGHAAQVLSATLPQGSIGIYQIRFQLPADLPATGRISLAVAQDGSISNTVTIPVQNVIQ